MTNKKEYTHEDIAVYRYNTHNKISSYNKIGLVRSLSGITCIGIGLITTLVPMTTIPLIMLGSYLLGYDSKIILSYLNHKRISLYNWFYANRTPKRIRRTLKRMVMAW